MREVVPGSLWLGNAFDADKLSRLLDLGVEAVICLAAEELPPKITRDLIYCRFPLLDGGGNSPAMLRSAITCVVGMINSKIPTFVHCGAGMSRSPAVVASALAVVRNQPPDEVLADLVRNHPHDVSPIFWQDVRSAIAREDSTEP